MNKEQMTQEQRAQLIEKLRAEYNDLNGKIARLNAFLCDIDFVKKVPDIIEQELMKGQLRAMGNYLYNLRGRIMFQDAQQKKEKTLDEWIKMKGQVFNKHIHLVNTDEQPIEIKTQREPTFDSNPKCYCCGAVIDGLPFIKDGKPVCEACATEHHHCGQDASCQVGDGSAAVNESQVPNSIKSLIGMQVAHVFHAGHKCDGCDFYTSCGRDWKKLELVGGYYICLAPLPNSIVTE